MGEKIGNEFTISQNRKFLESHEGLIFPDEHVRGNILVMGQGVTFPEQAYLFVKDTIVPKPEINSIATIDRNKAAGPSYYHASWPIISSRDCNPNAPFQPGKISRFTGEAGTILPQFSPASADLVLFMRDQDLSRQLETGLLSAINRVLTPGGVFVGSGSCYLPDTVIGGDQEEQNAINQYMNRLAQMHGFNCLQAVRLPTTIGRDVSGYNFSHYTAVAFQKKP